MGFFPGHPLQVFLRSNHPTMGSKRNLDSKSGMNGHPRAALDPIIEPPDSPMNSAGFYGFKTMKYTPQNRFISKNVLRHIFFRPTFFSGGMFFFHPRGPRGPNFFVDFFLSLMIPRGPRGSPGIPGALGGEKTMKKRCEGAGAPEPWF